MAITVYNVSATSARVRWPSYRGCRDTFYSVMYDPNWNGLLVGYTRKSFAHEERIPVSQTRTYVGNLLPRTAYFLCVTCQAANPTEDQCQVFSTPGDGGQAQDGGGWPLAAAVWMASSLLLLLVSGVLLWGCLHAVRPLPSRPAEARPELPGPGLVYGPGGDDDAAKQAAVIQNPLFAPQAVGRVTITPLHEMRGFTKPSGSEPA